MFLLRALLELVMLGALAGVAGTLIVLRKRAFFAVALSHATFPGGVLFAVLGWNLLLGQALFAVCLVLLLTLLARVPGLGKQAASGIVLTLGFALGTLLANLNTNLNVPVEALLVGSPLAVQDSDLLATATVLVLGAVGLGLLWRRFLFVTFDAQGAQAAGLTSWQVELFGTLIITAAVVVAMPAVGAILGVSVLIAPAAAAVLLAPGVRWVPALAALLGIAGGALGLWISMSWDLAAGGAVGLVLTCGYLGALGVSRLVQRARSRAAQAVML